MYLLRNNQIYKLIMNNIQPITFIHNFKISGVSKHDKNHLLGGRQGNYNVYVIKGGYCRGIKKRENF